MFVGLAILIIVIAALYPGFKAYMDERRLGKKIKEDLKKAQGIENLETSLVNLQEEIQSTISQCKKRQSE